MRDAIEEVLPSAEIREELARILSSRVFRSAHRSQRFLSYLVECAVSEPPVVAKEYTIAIDVFDREPSYDPSIDATVRVEASRLRSRLREFYDEEGKDDPLRIEIPKGGYGLAFHRRTQAGPADAAPEAPAPVMLPLGSSAETSAQPPRKIPLYLWAVCLLLIVGVIVPMVLWVQGRRRIPVSPRFTSLAILPVANQTGDAAMTYVTDGMTDDLIRQLSQVPALKLMARTTMFRYRNHAGDPRSVARELGVDAVMTSELRRTPERTTLAVELTDAHDGSAIIDREYIADSDDLRPMQAEVQRDVLAGLHAEDSARDPHRALASVTSSPQAYREFLVADALFQSGTPLDVHQAMVHAQNAVQLDPKFDLAWTALASEHAYLAIYFEPPREHMPLARQYAERALAINPNLGEAHANLGLVHLLYDWDLPAAQAEVHTADAEAAAISNLACTAHLIQQAGYPRTAEEMLGRMLTFDPKSGLLIAEMGCVDFYGGRYEEALRYYHRALDADPRSPVPYWGLGKTLNAEGRHADAVVALDGFRQHAGFEPPLLTAERGYAWGASGRREQALAVIHDLQAKSEHTWIDPYFVSEVYLSMNDRKDAFAWLDKALTVRSPFAISILTEPKWQPMRSDPRFAEAVQRMLHDHA